LKKLIPPFDLNQDEDLDNNFSINITLNNLIDKNNDNFSEKIEPYPIFQLYDYRISGFINSNGTGLLTYINQRARNTIEEAIIINRDKTTECGNLTFDIRVYDRESESIDQLISRGLKDEKNNYVGKLQARDILNNYSGIGVYRNGFRIRPLGDPDFDWLKLNEKRIQNPSVKIGSNQGICSIKQGRLALGDLPHSRRVRVYLGSTVLR